MIKFGKKFYRLFNKDINSYMIMHGNVECCIFTISDSYNDVLKYEVLNKKHLPIEIKNEATLFNWLNRRLIPANRIQYDRIISNYLNVYDSLTKLILDSYALSLSDAYWVKQVDDENN